MLQYCFLTVSLKPLREFYHRLFKLLVSQSFSCIRNLIWADATKSSFINNLLLHFTWNVFFSFHFACLRVLWRFCSIWWHTLLSIWMWMLSDVIIQNTTTTRTPVIIFIPLNVFFLLVFFLFLWFLSRFFHLSWSLPNIVWLIDIVN